MKVLLILFCFFLSSSQAFQCQRETTGFCEKVTCSETKHKAGKNRTQHRSATCGKDFLLVDYKCHHTNGSNFSSRPAFHSKFQDFADGSRHPTEITCSIRGRRARRTTTMTATAICVHKSQLQDADKCTAADAAPVSQCTRLENSRFVSGVRGNDSRTQQTICPEGSIALHTGNSCQTGNGKFILEKSRSIITGETQFEGGGGESFTGNTRKNCEFFADYVNPTVFHIGSISSTLTSIATCIQTGHLFQNGNLSSHTAVIEQAGESKAQVRLSCPAGKIPVSIQCDTDKSNFLGTIINRRGSAICSSFHRGPETLQLRVTCADASFLSNACEIL